LRVPVEGLVCRVHAGPGKPAISSVRIPLIRVCSRPRRGGGGGGGPEPLADGGRHRAGCAAGCRWFGH